MITDLFIPGLLCQLLLFDHPKPQEPPYKCISPFRSCTLNPVFHILFETTIILLNRSQIIEPLHHAHFITTHFYYLTFPIRSVFLFSKIKIYINSVLNLLILNPLLLRASFHSSSLPNTSWGLFLTSIISSANSIHRGTLSCISFVILFITKEKPNPGLILLWHWNTQFLHTESSLLDVFYSIIC